MGTINGRFGIKEVMVDDLILNGINLNELNPGSLFRDRRTRESRLLADTENWMLQRGVSLEDMKEGTFYDVLENDGRDVDGRKVTKEEARRIIDKYNNYNRNRYFDVDVKKMPKATKPLTLETLDDLRKSLGLPPDWRNMTIKKDEAKEKEKEEKEKARKAARKAKQDLVDEYLLELGLPPPPPEVDDDEAEGEPIGRGWLLDEGYRKMFKYMKPDPNEDPYEEDEEEQVQKKKKEKEEEEKIPDVPIKYEGSWESILTKHLNLKNLNLENATMV